MGPREGPRTAGGGPGGHGGGETKPSLRSRVGSGSGSISRGSYSSSEDVSGTAGSNSPKAASFINRRNMEEVFALGAAAMEVEPANNSAEAGGAGMVPTMVETTVSDFLSGGDAMGGRVGGSGVVNGVVRGVVHGERGGGQDGHGEEEGEEKDDTRRRAVSAPGTMEVVEHGSPADGIRGVRSSGDDSSDGGASWARSRSPSRSNGGDNGGGGRRMTDGVRLHWEPERLPSGEKVLNLSL